MSKNRNAFSSRREILKHGLTGAAGLAGASLFGTDMNQADAQPRRKPYVIVFHTDDQDFNTLGCYGADVLTPHIDSLADGGVCFNRGYVTTGVCNAARYALVTGEYPSRCRTPEFRNQFRNVPTEPAFNSFLADGQATIASAMKSAGYKTGFVGKWHLGGFDRDRMKRFEISKQWGPAWQLADDDVDPKDPNITAVLEHNHAVKREGIKRYGFDYAEAISENPEGMRSRNLNYHNPEWITEAAVDFIDQNRNEPFFLYLNHTLHHIPHPQESLLIGDPRVSEGGYLDKAPDIMPPRREIFERVVKEGYRPETAYCTWMDEALGVVLRRLGELSLSDDTLIIYIADNNVPAKGTIYEDGVRVPFIVRFPGRVRGGRRTESLVQNIDIAPTAMDVAGASLPSGMHLDGASMLPMLTGERDRIHDELFFEIGWTRACCTDRWKYLALRYPEAQQNPEWKYHGPTLLPHQHNALLWHPAFYYPDQLYDLNIDPHEVVNYSTLPEYSDVLADMKGRTRRWLRTFDNPFGEFTS